MNISKATGIPDEHHVGQDSAVIVFQKEGITITAFDISHGPIEPAVGYVIEYCGNAASVSSPMCLGPGAR